MAPRSIWRGAISFGMVAIPIKLYPATQSKDIPFVQLHDECHSRIRQRRYCPYHETYLEQSEIVRGFEYAKDQYLVMEPSDFEDLPVPSTRTIEITRFVQLADIDPMYFERGYMLEPETVGQKPFYLLKGALESSDRVAIAKVSLRQKEHLCCLRPYDKGLAMETMFYPDEIRPTGELDLPEDETVISEQEMAMAMTLIDQLTGPFEPEKYHDEYRETLHQVIEAKLAGTEPVTAAPQPAAGKVVDLMEALKASIEATKRESARPAPKAAAKKKSNAAPAKGKKKTPAKAAG